MKILTLKDFSNTIAYTLRNSPLIGISSFFSPKHVLCAYTSEDSLIAPQCSHHLWMHLTEYMQIHLAKGYVDVNLAYRFAFKLKNKLVLFLLPSIKQCLGIGPSSVNIRCA
ncbi:hypothetical protein CEXT_54731 [Caerostris extrusa]|uniref:Uncharacterized protein n=1 Tax=Caerostris extrusa TaxID=172846 RepID=A0AAV4QRK7_CAEEX|nr:hypothetical protein CEXT_54731 [Caerostris extrusa]